MTKLTRVLLFLAAVVLGAMWMSGCDSGPTASDPVVVASPSPSPTPTPYPRTHVLSCEQTNLGLRVVNGAGNDDVVFDYREIITAIASPRNAAGSPLPLECDYPRVVGWSVRGPACSQFGDLTGFVTYFQCLDPGELQIIATHGAWKAIWNARLIRHRSGVGVEIDPASVSVRTERNEAAR